MTGTETQTDVAEVVWSELNAGCAYCLAGSVWRPTFKRSDINRAYPREIFKMANNTKKIYHKARNSWSYYPNV